MALGSRAVEGFPSFLKGNLERFKMNPRRAFTLTELLMVIAVIAILAALLLPVLSSAKARARRAACLNNLSQINKGVHLYAGDNGDTLPDAGQPTFITYREVIKRYLGLNSASSPQDKIFACPADTFCYDENNISPATYLPQGHYQQAAYDCESYYFNGANLMTNYPNFHNTGLLPGVGGAKTASINDPTKTVAVAESAAYFPWSWHQPKPRSATGPPIFNDAQDMVSFVDGHVNFIKIYWNSTFRYPDGSGSIAAYHDPPAGYDYKWSGN